jgi:DNA-binding beta-propeller fold protein YncE
MATSVLDVTVPSAPRVVATLSTVAQDIVLRGNLAYIAAGAGGLRIYDVTNPSEPVLRWTVNSASGWNIFAKGVAVSSNGARAYLAAGAIDGVGRILVLNISDPSRVPLVVADVPTSQGGSASDVALDAANEFAYVADYGGGVQVFSLANPSNPVRVGAGYDTGDLATRLTVAGNLVLVATWSQQSARLVILDAGDPANLEELGSVPGLYSGCFDTFENYVLLPSPSLGLVIVDLANPSVPKTVFTVDTPGAVYSVCRSGNMVYLGDSAAILDVVNLFGD